MAFVTTGYWLSLSAIDYGQNETRKRWKMTAATSADAATDAATVIAAFEAVSDAEVTGYVIELGYVEDALTIPTTVNPVSVVASNTALIDGAGNKKVNFSIPSPNIGIFEGATGDAADIVDSDDAALIAYLALFQDAGELLVSDGETMGDFLKGIRVTQSRRLSGGN